MSDFSGQLRRHLLALGCPPAPLRRIVRELNDHHDDLREAALAAGLPPSTAQARADAELGDPATLAARHMAVLRASSWWGRHPALAFGLLPLLTVPLLWLLWLALGIGAVWLLVFFGDRIAFGHAVNNPAYFPYFALGLQVFSQLGFAGVALLFCWQSRRFALGAKWAFTACAIVAMYAFLLWARISPHNFSLYAGIYLLKIPFNSFANAAIPLLTIALTYALQRRAASRSELS